MTALGSPVSACGVCGDTGKWLAGYTGLFGGSVPVYETCKCAATKGNLYIGLANGDEWAQDEAARLILGEAKAVAPAGWKLVPIKLTNEMEALLDWAKKGQPSHNIWLNLLAAAPVAQAMPVAAEKDVLSIAAKEVVRIHDYDIETSGLPYMKGSRKFNAWKALRAALQGEKA